MIKKKIIEYLEKNYIFLGFLLSAQLFMILEYNFHSKLLIGCIFVFSYFAGIISERQKKQLGDKND